MAKYKADSREYAAAMEAAVRQCGLERVIRQSGPLLYFNGWWRTGVHPNCLVNLEEGTWFDLQTSHWGNARDFAQVCFNLDLKAFMERFGRVDRSRPIVPPPPRPPPRAGLPALWEALAEQPSARAARWLESERGVPAAQVDSGFAFVDDAVVDLFPPDLHRWLRAHVARNGPSVAAPLRDPSGEVINIHLRPVGGGERRFMPKALLSSDAGPAAYGFPQSALAAGLTVVCEGLVDTLFAEACVRAEPSSVAIGAASSSTMPAWAQWLSRKSRGVVVVVPHVDENGAGQMGAAFLLNALNRVDIPARAFSWDTFHEALGDTSPRDLGDALKVAPFARARDAFIAGCAA